MQIWALIVDSFRHTLDRKLFWVMLAISVMIAAAMASVSFDEHGVSLFFGAHTIDDDTFAPDSPTGRAAIGALVTHLTDLWIGWVGVIVALVATAGVFPALMEKGAVDVILSKPVSRTVIFLARYAGSMIFVLVQAMAFVLLTFVVIGTRWHYWEWRYLWCVLLIPLLFSYIYVMGVLFAVTTRSAMTSLLLALVCWVVFWIPQAAFEVFETNRDLADQVRWRRTMAVLRWCVPKTSDIPLIAAQLVKAGTSVDLFVPDSADLSEDRRADIAYAADAERRLQNLDIAKSVGSSLAFEAVILLFAVWRFSRQDF